MSLPRFFCEAVESTLAQGKMLELSAQEGAHLRRVLRIQIGERVELVNGRGLVATATVAGFTKDIVQLHLDSITTLEDDRIPVALIVSLLKAERMDWLMEKATELGPHTIMPVITERSIRPSHDKRGLLRLERWNIIARQTLKQCKGIYLPLIHPPMPIDHVIQGLQGKGFMLNEMEMKAFLASSCMESKSFSFFSLCIGPEGAFSPQEARLLVDAGFESVSLGRRILRAETAAIAGLGIMSSVLNEQRKSA